MLQDQYYEKAGDTLKRFKEVVAANDPCFVAKAAVFARQEFGLRSISHAAAAEVVHAVKGEPWTKDFINAVVHRPDDMTEIMAYYISTYGKPIPNSLKKGLGMAFAKFDQYQLAKYRGEGKSLGLVDLANLVHPRPTGRNAEALTQLVNGTLRSTGTWESKLSAAGKSENKAEAKVEAWQELLVSGRIGYFALLRNLCNIATDAPHLIDRACELLTNEAAIHRSLVLPFRFSTAYTQVEGHDRRLIVALNKAVDLSCTNVPDMPNSLVVVDYSSSMGEGYDSNRGKGTLLGAVLAKRSNADFMIFGDNAAYVPYNPVDSTLTLWERFMANNQGWQNNIYSTQRKFTNKSGVGGIEVGHGTNFNDIFDTAAKPYDRIFVFSDMQGWRGGGAPIHAVENYKKRHKCNPFIYSMDMTGSGTMMFHPGNVAAIPGFSEKIFDLIRVLEQDKNALIKKIEAIRFV